MNKFVEEYLYVSDDEKVREKVMLTRIGLSIAFILICLAAMTLSAYGFFASEQTTPYMVISSANYEIDVEAPADALGPAAGVYTLVNDTDSPKEFVFKVSRKATPTAASVGYCKIKVKTDANDMTDYEDIQAFYTEPIGKYVKEGLELEAQTREITFTVAPRKTAMITFIAEYGSCSREPIENNRIEPQFAVNSSVTVEENPEPALNEEQTINEEQTEE